MTSKTRYFVFVWLFFALPITALANEYYVSPQGSNSNPGTKAQPWQTIHYAMERVAPGDVVLVEDGVYQGTVIMARSGNPGAYITLKSVNKWGAKIEITNGNGNTDGIKAAANYLIIDGFEMYDVSPQIGHHGNGVTVYNNHHVHILNNKIHDFGGSGIQAAHFDHVLVENNVVYNNAKYNPNQSSGISMFQARAVDNAPGYHVIVRNNRSYGNINVVLSGNPIGTTDGNGILVDDFQNAYSNSHGVFPHRTLVENNLSYDNGGKGVQVYQSDFVDVFNNTAYHNNHDQQNTGTWRAELSLIYSHHTVWRNNIGVANPGPGEILQWNRGILIAESDNTVWENNITFNGSPGDKSINLSNTPVTESDLANNMLGVNPLFMNEFAQDFSLNLESPAINAGSDQIVSFIDINYQPRPRGTVDIGAFEFDDGNLPVELTAFEAVASGTSIELSWETASELNNAGFAVELAPQGFAFQHALFVEGKGTTNTPQSYQATLTDLAPGTYTLRLKQIDFDGTFAYSPAVEVDIAASAYQLAQSYPNPFNPQTRIQYTLPLAGHVDLTVFDLLGRKIETLVNQEQPAGTHSVLFNARDLPNGTYVYRLTAGAFSETKSMVLLK
ncbi:MAG: right-handed parallel beta-helix repeat-containing protein [Rhodothermaceae bacterium]|nr:right-handed parallel beta-helix repeat-containing protein [Rhodothermaceae bacterium]